MLDMELLVSPSSPDLACFTIKYGVKMSHPWMYGNRCAPAFREGVNSFLLVAEANKSKQGFMCCPCLKCKNEKDYSCSRDIKSHLLRFGFMSSYNVWTKHGEEGVMMEDGDEEEDNDDQYRSMFSECNDTAMDDNEEEGGEEQASDDPVDDDLRRAISDARRDCGTDKERLQFDKMLEDHHKLLYPGTAPLLLCLVPSTGVVRYMLYLIEQCVHRRILILPTALVPVAATNRDKRLPKFPTPPPSPPSPPRAPPAPPPPPLRLRPPPPPLRLRPPPQPPSPSSSDAPPASAAPPRRRPLPLRRAAGLDLPRAPPRRRTAGLCRAISLAISLGSHRR
ncbi:hypothetical protein QYE76_071601 [Lolium multiflorum]|uniref:Transposase-associated domain-containing protein n=1 Tax=Lolium multiflorum TaxID=4521 RepID=A0AAD8SKE3_LOLMU|nr:hypothetical protein QYE76_071601 [Lolium multiflorum]